MVACVKCLRIVGTTALDPGGTLANLISPAVETARRKQIELLQVRGHKITEVELAPDAAPEDDIVANMEIFPSGYNSPEAYAQRVKECTNTYASGELYPLGKISMSATMSSSGAEKVLLFMIFSAQNRLGNKIYTCINSVLKRQLRVIEQKSC